MIHIHRVLIRYELFPPFLFSFGTQSFEKETVGEEGAEGTSGEEKGAAVLDRRESLARARTENAMKRTADVSRRAVNISVDAMDMSSSWDWAQTSPRRKSTGKPSKSRVDGDHCP